MGKTEGPYHPSLVRVGVNVHHSVSSISIDQLIKKKLAHSDGAVSQSLIGLIKYDYFVSVGIK